MFYTADILIDVHPVIHALFVKCPILPSPFVAGESGKIPATLKKRIHRIRLAYRIAAALRAFAKFPSRMFVQRVAFAGYLNVVGQSHR